jgi:hypothetical protein
MYTATPHIIKLENPVIFYIFEKSFYFLLNRYGTVPYITHVPLYRTVGRYIIGIKKKLKPYT